MIDYESFSAALHAGAFDACLDYLRREEGGGSTEASLNCRATEARLARIGREPNALEHVECFLIGQPQNLSD